MNRVADDPGARPARAWEGTSRLEPASVPGLGSVDCARLPPSCTKSRRS